MKQTGNMLAGFAKRLKILDKEFRSLYKASDYHLEHWENREKWDVVKSYRMQHSERKNRETARQERYRKQIVNIDQSVSALRQAQENNMAKLAQALARKETARSARESIAFRQELEKQFPGIRAEKYTGKQLDGDLFYLAANCTQLYRAGKKKDAAKALAKLDALYAREMKEAEETIQSLRTTYFAYLSGVAEGMEERKQQLLQEEKAALERQWNTQGISSDEAERIGEIHRDRGWIVENVRRKREERFNRITDAFLGQYPPPELRELCSRAYGEEPSWKYGTPPAEMPECAFLGMLEYPLDSLDLSDDTQNFLRKHYPFLFREDSLWLPWAPELGDNIGFRFHYWQESQDLAAISAREAALRMCLISPAGMAKFILTDPEQLGESFSSLAALDPGGKLWGSLRSDPDDIERALRELAKHITDVNQRCLRGEFANLAEYNRSGAGIPEKFRVLVLMDYPMGLTERSLELLEQILRSGPKCGVLPFVFVNGSLMLKCSEARRKRALELIGDMPMLRMDASGGDVTLDGAKTPGGKILYHSAPLPEREQLRMVLDARRQDD